MCIRDSYICLNHPVAIGRDDICQRVSQQIITDMSQMERLIRIEMCIRDRYPDSPYSEEALLMHGEILFNRKEYKQALADYKQLQTLSLIHI